jgi:hypothetical protein
MCVLCSLLVAIYIIGISINRGDCLIPTVLDMSWLPRGECLHLAASILVLQVHFSSDKLTSSLIDRNQVDCGV